MAEGKKLKVVLVTPQGEKIAGEADQITAPGHLGQFGVLPDHVEFFTRNPPGVLNLVLDGSPQVYAIGKGFIEVSHDQVQLLVQSAERGDEIDAERARRSLEKAEAGLSGMIQDHPIDDPQVTELMLRRARALARLEAAGQKT